tara:strand:- start:2455 stop:3216 length:762 start_codon:yes stop_codon:yes gene_type:complete
MGNCSNISNTQSVSLTAGTITSGFCHTSLQTTYEEFIARTTASLSGNLAGFVAGDDTPSASDQNKLWFKQDASNCNNPLGWYFYNSSTSAWEPVLQRIGPPIGSISMWYTGTPPTDWLICDGTTFSATDYPDLNTLLGGNTLPDLKGRMPIGVGQQSSGKWDSTAEDYSASGTDFALADSGGTEDHKLLTAELPSHNHAVEANNQNYVDGGTARALGSNNGSDGTYNSSSVGSDSPHNNLPPYLALNFIICAK